MQQFKKGLFGISFKISMRQNTLFSAFILSDQIRIY